MVTKVPFCPFVNGDCREDCRFSFGSIGTDTDRIIGCKIEEGLSNIRDITIIIKKLANPNVVKASPKNN